MTTDEPEMPPDEVLLELGRKVWLRNVASEPGGNKTAEEIAKASLAQELKED